MKKILFASIALLSAIAFTSCDQDFLDGIAGPLTSDPETPQTVAFGNGAITEVSVINLAEVTSETVQVCKIKAPTVTDEKATFKNYTITINDVVYDLSANGEMSTEDLIAIIENAYGKRPVERDVKAVVRAYYDVNGQSIVTVSDVFLIKAVPEAPEIEAAYYLTGTLNGWDNTNTDYKLTNDGRDPYENPTFTCRIPAPEDGGNIEFKMTPESGLGGDWSKCLCAGSTPGTFVYNNGGGNFVIEAVEGAKYYDLTFNMMELTWSYKAVNFEAYIWQAGNANGWGSPADGLYGEDGKYQGYMYLDGEFKFRSHENSWDAPDWGSGGSEGTLAAQAGNLSAQAGFYQVNVDLAAMTYSLTKVESIGIIGDFNGWGGDVEMTYNTTDKCWEATTTVTDGGLKFRMNHDWAVNWGGDTNNLAQDGANISVSAGTYKFQLYLSYAGKHRAVITKQ